MIHFPCEGCGHPFHVEAKFGGKRFRCKHCGHVGKVPASEPEFDPYGLDEVEPASSTARAQSGLQPVNADQVVRAGASGTGSTFDGPEFGDIQRTMAPVRRKKEGRDQEAPVLGLPVDKAILVFLGLLILTTFLPVLYCLGTNQLAFQVLLVTGIASLIGLALNVGVMFGTCQVCDVEVSSLRRLLAIALAMAAIFTLFTFLWTLTGGHPSLGTFINVVLNCAILANTLRLGCGGLIVFMCVEFLILILVGMAITSLMMGFRH